METMGSFRRPQTVTDHETSENDVTFLGSPVTQKTAVSATPKPVPLGTTSQCIKPAGGASGANAPKPATTGGAASDTAPRPKAPFPGVGGSGHATPACPPPPIPRSGGLAGVPPAVGRPRAPAFRFGRPLDPFRAGAGVSVRSSPRPPLRPAPPKVRPFPNPLAPPPYHRPAGPLWPMPPKVQSFNNKPQPYQPYTPELAKTAEVRQCAVRPTGSAGSSKKAGSGRRTPSTPATPASSTPSRGRTPPSRRSTGSSATQGSRTDRTGSTSESERSTTEGSESSGPPSDVTSEGSSLSTTEGSVEEQAAFKAPAISSLPPPPKGPWLEPAVGGMTPQVKLAIDDFVRTAAQTGVKGFANQFTAMKKYRAVNYSVEAFRAHRKKNRYHDVGCIDTTRVVLKLNVPPKPDYIHANWVKMAYVKQVFIATQAPKGDTTEDFWRMCYQESVKTIVVLCNVVEKGRPRCAQYWPVKVNGKASYGSFTVRSRRVVRDRSLETYTLSVAAAGKPVSLSLKLLHLTNWPDRGVPVNGIDVHRILYLIDKSGPCVVHCSAGIGRTGTILAIAAIVERLFKGIQVRMADVFKELRSQRAGAIQTDVQYAFIVLAVLEHINVKFPSIYGAQIAAFQADAKTEEAVRKYRKKVRRTNAKKAAKKPQTSKKR